MQLVAMSPVKSQPASLFTIITSLKYKFVLCLLKEDGRKSIGFGI